MHRRFGLVVAFSVVTSTITGVFAQERVAYNDHTVVRARIDDMRDTRVLLGLGGRLWSESWGVETVDVMLPSARLATLAKTRIEYEVIIPNVQEILDAERARLTRNLDRRRVGIGFFDEYQRAEDIIAFYDALESARPDLVESRSIGTSIEGRDIRAYTISNAGSTDAPAVYVNTGAHAREWIGPATIAYFSDRLVNDYGVDPRITQLVDSVVWHIVPLANPDGYVHSWDVDRLWRKNRRNNGNGSFGVDWNRNFDANWGGDGSSGSTGSDIYRGTGPFSEPETAAIRDDVRAIDNLLVFLDVHCYSQLVLWPYGYQIGEPEGEAGDIFRDLGIGIRDAIASVNGVQFSPQPAYDLYVASGTSQDWAWDDTGAFAYTYELRDTGTFGFLLPPDQIVPSGTEILESLLYIGEQVIGNVAATFPSGRPTEIASDQEVTIDVELSSAFVGLATETGLLRRRVNGGEWTSSPLQFLGGDLFRGQLTAGIDCDDVLEFDFEIETTSGSLVRVDDAGSPWSALGVEIQSFFDDDVESDLGWSLGVAGDTATTGVWVRVDPIGTGAQPEDDASPGVGALCFVTGQGSPGGSLGENDIDGGETTLRSPVIDLDGGDLTTLSFEYWFTNDAGASPNEDVMSIEWRFDGGPWISILEVETSATAWRSFSVDFDPNVAGTVQLQFRASDLGSGSIVEAAIDEISVSRTACSSAPCPGDLDGSGAVDGGDLGAILSSWGACTGCPGDLNGDGAVNGGDLGQFLSSWGPCP